MTRALALLALLTALLAPAAGADERSPRRIDALPFPPPSRPAPDGLIPQGRVAEGTGLAAWYAAATRRYGHGVLGDAVEGGRLVVSAEGRRYAYDLPDDSVFEDLEPRIVDADGDGSPEILTIKSYLNAGATIALFGLRDGSLRPLAEAAPIGTPNRWLNPAGVADFDGDGRIEIAVVETPHIGGQLILYRWDGSARIRKALRTQGYSTHRTGSTVLAMSATLDWNRDGVPDLALPRQDRAVLAIVTAADGDFRELANFPHPAAIATPLLLQDLDDGRPAILYGLADGSAWALAIE